MSLKSNQDGFNRNNAQFNTFNPLPDIDDKIGQELSRIFGWDYNNLRWNMLLCDVDGRLLVSSSATQNNVAVQSQPSIGTSSTPVVSANPSRRSLYMQNLSGNNIYLAYGVVAVTNQGVLLPPNGLFIEDRFTGAINAIAAAASSLLSCVEI